MTKFSIYTVNSRLVSYAGKFVIHFVSSARRKSIA